MACIATTPGVLPELLQAPGLDFFDFGGSRVPPELIQAPGLHFVDFEGSRVLPELDWLGGGFRLFL